MAPVVPLGITDFAGTIGRTGVTWSRVVGMRSRRTPWGKEVATFWNGTFLVHFRHSPPTGSPGHPIRALIQLFRMASFTRSSLNTMIH
jgi:hypothetical protein